MEARAARFDEEDQLKKLRTQVQKQTRLAFIIMNFRKCKKEMLSLMRSITQPKSVEQKNQHVGECVQNSK